MRSTMQTTPLLLSRFLDYGATAYADSEVITWTADGPRRSTNAEVAADCKRLANALRSLGVTGDQRVGTFMWNNEEHLELYIGVPSMGAVLHTINIRLFPQQMIFTINHAEDYVVVVDNTLAEPFSKILAHAPTVKHVIVNGPVPEEVKAALAGDGAREVHDYRALLDAQPAEFEWPVLDENDGASMCYTSGTTGDPKGVVYSHRSNYLHTLQLAMPTALSLKQGDVVLTIVPLFHANSWGVAYAGFATGATLVLPDRFLQAAPLATMIEQLKVTNALAVPTIWNDLLHHLEAHPESDISTLKSAIVGGSACPPALMKAFQEKFDVTVYHGWGMTETSPLATVAVPPPGLEGQEYWDRRFMQGRLSMSVDARLVGPDGETLPNDGESVGEVEVRGPWITASYYNADAPEKFDDGWLRTGDVGKLTPDLFLTLTDRAKDVIKSGGEWISSVDLENQLMAHPAVREASVVGVPDEKWGERPLATVVLEEGSSVTTEELRDFLAERVARWQVPERWAFIAEVPKTSVGKFDKKVIRARYADGDLEVVEVGKPAS
ncbi:long-chain fatty acid--CoA ligase [Spongisporangium articulatum]|uniref:Long-chain fatty acid--CoA ligase n=1 Tax=Spongisporangium articulatum TaxID=3362603 RepID=A0ABW8AIG5_9ACTN